MKGENMGRGDRRTKKGKIWRASYGNSRPQKVKKAPVAPKPPAEAQPPEQKQEEPKTE